MATAHDVAAHILKRYGPMTPLKLHKLLYYVQGWYLAWKGEPLFAEPFEAWGHGPVCQPLYKHHKGFKDLLHSWDYGNPQPVKGDAVYGIDCVWRIKGHLTATQLRNQTHQESPWLNARVNVKPDNSCQDKISTASMKSSFSVDLPKQVGRGYAHGRFSLGDVARLLKMSRPDAVVFLETNGYARPLSKIALSDDERAVKLAAMREERLKRNGKPVDSRDSVKRSVIATQHLEGVDARPWMKD
jgi:uncharacterized phage-associated protein